MLQVRPQMSETSRYATVKVMTNERDVLLRNSESHDKRAKHLATRAFFFSQKPSECHCAPAHRARSCCNSPRGALTQKRRTAVSQRRHSGAKTSLASLLRMAHPKAASALQRMDWSGCVYLYAMCVYLSSIKKDHSIHVALAATPSRAAP